MLQTNKKTKSIFAKIVVLYIFIFGHRKEPYIDAEEFEEAEY